MNLPGDNNDVRKLFYFLITRTVQVTTPHSYMKYINQFKK